MDRFAELLRINPFVRYVEMSNWGEIFLNPDLLDILAYGFEHGVQLYAENGTNLNTVSGNVLEGLVRYRFRSLFCSIDGASQETYSRYRVGGDFATVIRNIEKINDYKKKHGCRFPLLTWQFIVFPHNRHEIPRAHKMASKLGMGFFTKQPWGQGGEDLRRRPNLYICAQLWTGPQIDFDGEMLGCCTNKEPWGAGNVFTSGLLAAVNGEKMQQARAMVLGRGEERDDIPCAHCRKFLWMKTHHWLSIHKVHAMLLMIRARRFLPVRSKHYARLHKVVLRFMG